MSLNHYESPAQSPDLNPIQLVWHDLKHYLSTEIQPYSYEQLINGITRFWHNQVTVKYCNSKIDHLYNVIN